MDPVHYHGSRDPAQDGIGHFNVHTWTGSRSSSTDVAFDSNGADINAMGYPTMNQVAEQRLLCAPLSTAKHPFCQDRLWTTTNEVA